MRDDDIEQVHQIDLLSFSMPWPARSYQYELHENPASMSWVAEYLLSSAGDSEQSPDHGCQRIAGMIVMWLIMDEAHIATIAVHPDYRRRGIAEALLITALQAAARHGAKEATLEVRAGNQAAQKLYQKFNFEIAGVRPRYYRDNDEDALIMTLHNLGATISQE
jgi:[ribosomal protein S18]-alanine N-acetyltransferase